MSHVVVIDLANFVVDFTSKEVLNIKELRLFLKSYYQEFFPSLNLTYKSYLPDNEQKCYQFFKDVIYRNQKFLDGYNHLNQDIKDDILYFIDSLYDYYRSLSRFIVFVNNDERSMSRRQMMNQFNVLAKSVVSFYRDIYETCLNDEQTVYRVLPSGANAGLLFSQNLLKLNTRLSFLDNIPLLEAVVTQPPFMLKTKQNKRVGTFFKQDHYVSEKDFDYKNSYGVLVKIYNTTGLVYFDREYLGYLAAISNLFQVVSYSKEKDTKIDFIVLFGTNNDEDKCYYYEEEDMLVGVMPKKANIDYFGYVKKIMLTLFNLKMIKQKLLPIHGAGIKITSNGKSKNFVILGDSGAGKSETIEAIRHLYGSTYQIDTIFDDMGTFHIKDDKVFTTGTEIGAFVRLDDLDQGYSLKSMDRAVFFNIDQVNSRVVVPIETYAMTYELHQVDAFLLADNYSDNDKGITYYDDSKLAKADFVLGKRVALNTTQEKGLVSTYFANPFGPVQEKEFVETYLQSYFDTLFKNNVPVGKIYTRLSLDRKQGPYIGAKALIELFESLK